MNASSIGNVRWRTARFIQRRKVADAMRIGAWMLAFIAASAAHAGSVNYSYDALGRLAQVVYSNGTTTTTISYSYDAAGNRTSVATTSP